VAGGGGSSSAVVTTEAELCAAVKAGGPDTVVVQAGARIELTGGKLMITRSVRLVGVGGGSLPAIVGAEGEDRVLSIFGGGVAVQLEGLRIEGRGESSADSAIFCRGGASLVAVRCELAGNQVSFNGEGTRGELRDCAVLDSKGYGLFVYGGASLVMEGGAVRGCAGMGVMVNVAGTHASVRTLPLCLCASCAASNFAKCVRMGRS
jgi:hypothetical protein